MNKEENNNQSFFTLTFCALGLTTIGIIVLIMAIPLLVKGASVEKLAGVCWGIWAPGAFYMSFYYIKKIKQKLIKK